MKPHKHSELIKAWADGAEIEFKSKVTNEWTLFDNETDAWINDYEYRIKPETKPDTKIMYVAYKGKIVQEGERSVKFCQDWPNLVLTFDGETGELKSAEVLK